MKFKWKSFLTFWGVLIGVAVLVILMCFVSIGLYSVVGAWSMPIILFFFVFTASILVNIE